MWSTDDETLDILRDLYSDADDLVEKQGMDHACTSEIFIGGKNTIIMHNTREDSLLVTPLIYNLVILGELCERITMKKAGAEKWEAFHPVLSLIPYMLKAPRVPSGAPVVNAIFTQRCAIVNVMRACLGLAPDNHMKLEHRLESTLDEMQKQASIGRRELGSSSIVYIVLMLSNVHKR